MARESRKHRRGPGDIRFVPYDPNQKAERSWKWRWWVGGGLALLVLLVGGLWGLRHRDPPSPVAEGPVPAAVVTDTNVATATPEEPVVPDLPFSSASGLATGEEAESTACHGRVRILANAPDYARAFLSNTAKRVRLDTNHWITAQALPYILTNAVCGDMDVWLEADGFKSDVPSRRAVIQEGRTSDVAFLLTPLPATLLLACDEKDVVAQIGNVKSSATNVFSVASLQPVRVTVTASDSPAQALALGPYEPLTTNRHVVAFKRAAGAVRIEATVPTNAAAFFQGLEKRIRISSNDWKTVTSLPYVADGLPCEELPVDLVVTGFQMVGTARRSVRVIDAQTNVVLFRLEPLPATLTITCDVTGAVIQIENRQSASGDPVPVPSLKSLDLTVSATGYVTRAIRLAAMEPGKAYRQDVRLVVKAKPVVPASMPANRLGSKAHLVANESPDLLPKAHSGKYRSCVNGLAFSPDGRLLISGSHDDMIKVWSLPDGNLVKTLNGHTAPVGDLVISADGTLLISGGWDNTIRFWSLPGGELQSTLKGGSNTTWCVATSADGTMLASGHGDIHGGEIRLWSLPDQQLKAVLKGIKQSVWALAISPDGKLLVSGDEAGVAQIWALPQGELQNTLTTNDVVRNIAISPDGSLLVLGVYKAMEIWSLPNPELRNRLTIFDDYVNVHAVAINPEGTLMASGSGDSLLRLWSLPDAKLQATMDGHGKVGEYGNGPLVVAFSPDGQLIASGDNNGRILLWELGGKKRHWALFDPDLIKK